MPSRSAASKKQSGAGLPRAASSAEISNGGSGSPAAAKRRAANSLGADLTIAQRSAIAGAGALMLTRPLCPGHWNDAGCAGSRSRGDQVELLRRRSQIDAGGGQVHKQAE